VKRRQLMELFADQTVSVIRSLRREDPVGVFTLALVLRDNVPYSHSSFALRPDMDLSALVKMLRDVANALEANRPNMDNNPSP
jgi:hypothetical protein